MKNRTIKFRGKILNGERKGEWVYGNLIQTPTKTYILETEHEIEFIEPEYHEQGMGCGLEDRNITDRYDAMYHGWDRALDKCAENHPPFIEVDPNTVGHYTGLHDKSDNEIYKDDMLRDSLGTGKVIWMAPSFVVVDYNGKVWNLGGGMTYPENHIMKETEIIGNIHDNPTLLTQ